MTPPGNSGLAIIAEHLATLGATILLVGIWITAGGRILSRFHAGTRSWPAPLPVLTQALLGQGACGLVVLALGAAGVLWPAVVVGILAAALFALRRDLRLLAAAARRIVVPGALLPRAALAAFAAVVLLMIVLALAPPWDWDTLMYHQALPLEFLRSGAIRMPPDTFHIGVIGVGQLASLPLLALGLPAGPALASVASYVITGAATFALARVMGVETDGWWSLLLFLGVPALILVAVTARMDVTVAGALAIAHAVLLLAVFRRERGTLVIAAVCFGIAGGMKLHALAYAAACAPVALPFLKDRRALARSLAAFAIVLAPWLAKNALLVEAPFFPIGAPLRLEPWLAAITGSNRIPEGFDIRALTQLGESRAAFNLWDAFLHPARLTIEGEGAFYGLPLVLLLLPASLFAIRHRPAALALALPALGYLALVIIPFSHTNLRYLFPAIPPLLVACVIGVRAALPRRPASPGWHRILVVAVLGWSCVTVFPAVAPGIGPDALLLRWAAGTVPRDQVRALMPDAATRDIAALDSALSGLGDEALVLLLWEARKGGLGPRTLADTRLSNWPLLSQTAAPASCLSGTGISHVVINRRSVTYYMGRGASAEAFRIPQLGEFVRTCLGKPREVRSYLVYPVRATGPPVTGRMTRPQAPRGGAA